MISGSASHSTHGQEDISYVCLLMLMAQVYSGKGRHVTVNVQLMKGEYDHRLQWPFEHNVMYEIHNWRRDENHVIKTSAFKIADSDCNPRVTSEQRAKFGRAFHKFLPHFSLSDGAAKDTQYLRNDCLCLQVLKVEPPKS